MRTSEKLYPENKKELLDECKVLISRYDLYTLGKPRDPEDPTSWPDGTEDYSGEWPYGVAMIPAQWVTHVLERDV